MVDTDFFKVFQRLTDVVPVGFGAPGPISFLGGSTS